MDTMSHESDFFAEFESAPAAQRSGAALEQSGIENFSAFTDPFADRQQVSWVDHIYMAKCIASWYFSCRLKR